MGRPMGARSFSFAGTVALVSMAAASAAGAQDVTIGIAFPGNQGSGTVTSSPAGINCTLAGQGGTGTCSAQFATGTPVTLTATPAAHNTLGSWGTALAAQCPSSSLTCQFTARSGLSFLDLSFTAERYPLTIVGAGIGIGMVEASVIQGPWYGGSLNCRIVAGVTSGGCATEHAVGLPINLRFNNSGTNTASGVIYTPTPGIMPAAPHTIVAYITAPGFRIVSAGGPGTGRVVASGDAVIDCTVSTTGVTGSCYKDYGLQPQNSLVTLQATPSPGSTFLGWSGACTGTGTCLYNSSDLDIKEYSANFGSATTATFSIRIGSGVIRNDGDGVVTSSPAGIDCTITDRSATGTCDASFPEGTTVTLTATPAAGNTFGIWSGGSCGASPTCQVTTSGSINLFQVAFNPTRATLTIVGAGVGRVRIEGDHSFDFLGIPDIGCTVSNGAATGGCTTQFPVNKRIVLHWENPPSGVSTLTSVGPLTCVLAFCSGMMPNGPLTAVATVIAPAFRILSGGGSGEGRVVSNAVVNPIDCTVSPSQVAGKCSDDFGSKELPAGGVVLQATASPGSRFVGWSGSGGCSGTGTCLFDRTEVGIVDYVATFAQATVSLSIAGAGTGNGVVTSSAGGLTCVVTKGTANASGCSTPVTEGAAVTLTADPQGGSVFAGWTGDGCSGVSLTCTLTLSQTRTIVARFTAPRPGRDVAMALLGGAPLDAEERAQLDRFGNKDGVFNLGDLLALLDRTGEHLTPGTTGALIEADRRTKSTPTTSPRSTP